MTLKVKPKKVFEFEKTFSLPYYSHLYGFPGYISIDKNMHLNINGCNGNNPKLFLYRV